jgi:ABC-type Mn2+/Zn2+ transport system ATPase subunit
MNSEIEAILERFKHRVIFYRSYKRAYSQIQNAIENTHALGEPVCAILLGINGAGKSTLCKYFEKYHSSDPIVRR